MSNTTRNILAGIGSLLDFMPANDRRMDARIMTPAEIDRAAWEMVGKSFRAAMRQVHGKQPRQPQR